MKKVFLITYTVYNVSNSVVKSGTMKVKNKSTEFEAKCSLEEFLKKKHSDFSRMVVDQCKEDTLGAFGNIFGDILGKDYKWPF